MKKTPTKIKRLGKATIQRAPPGNVTCEYSRGAARKTKKQDAVKSVLLHYISRDFSGFLRAVVRAWFFDCRAASFECEYSQCGDTMTISPTLGGAATK